MMHAFIIPGAHYCLESGSPTINNIGAGACTDVYAVEAAGQPPNDAAMLGKIREVRSYCAAKTP